jgi:riboflavin biosynthesis pyrimidine reductase
MRPQSFDELSPEQLVAEYNWPPEVKSRVNIVVNEIGSLLGDDGTSKSLTNATDRHILHLIRREAEIILVGAQSVRAEGWHIPTNGRLIVVSSKTINELPPCPHPERVKVEKLETALLQVNEVDHWLCEGGRSTIIELIARSVIDELCISIQAEGPSDTPSLPQLPQWLADAAPEQFVLTSLIVDGTMLFTRWRRG